MEKRHRAKTSKESKAHKIQRTLKIIRRLDKEYPNAHCALDHNNPLELLIATILSAQCTDERVNIVTKNLFKTYGAVEAYAAAPLKDLEVAVKSTGFFRNKAKAIKEMSKILIEKHQGQVPKDMDALRALPGVGRKTANVVLGNAFNIASGVVVDTHVGRLSRRLGLTSANSAEAVERDLEQIVPKEHWIMFSHWLIWHGRATCKARKPDCLNCCVLELCPQKTL